MSQKSQSEIGEYCSEDPTYHKIPSKAIKCRYHLHPKKFLTLHLLWKLYRRKFILYLTVLTLFLQAGLLITAEDRILVDQNCVLSGMAILGTEVDLSFTHIFLTCT